MERLAGKGAIVTGAAHGIGRAICAELARYAVPSTLVHGDLHLGNVARLAGRYLFFDWTDGCVAHPFFDTISIFQTKQARDPGVQARLRDSYLGVWAGYESIERLREAWTLAKPLSRATCLMVMSLIASRSFTRARRTRWIS